MKGGRLPLSAPASLAVPQSLPPISHTLLLQLPSGSSPADLAVRNGYTSLAERLQGVTKGTIPRPARPEPESQEQAAADLSPQEREAAEAAVKPGFAGAGTEGTVMCRCGRRTATACVVVTYAAVAPPCTLMPKLAPPQVRPVCNSVTIWLWFAGVCARTVSLPSVGCFCMLPIWAGALCALSAPAGSTSTGAVLAGLH